MNILGRDIGFNNILTITIQMMRMIIESTKFNDPLNLWRFYINPQKPVHNQINLRNGLKILLSSNPYDIGTAMVVFCKKEYGNIIPGSIVVDIGANIGTFSLYAALSKASLIYAIEPNSEAFNTLKSNIQINSFDGIIIPVHAAVSSKDNVVMSIPIQSSHCNQVHGFNSNEEYEQVNTISLTTLMEVNKIARIDFLKLDCEGAEYDILMNCPATTMKKIKRIRLAACRN